MAQSKIYRIRSSAGNEYTIMQWQQLVALVEQQLINTDAEIMLPGSREWIPVRRIPKVVKVIRETRDATWGQAAAAAPRQAVPATGPATRPVQVPSPALEPFSAEVENLGEEQAEENVPPTPAAKPKQPAAAQAKTVSPSRSGTRAATSPSRSGTRAATAPSGHGRARLGPAARAAGREKAKKPVAFALFPAVLSLLPGLGQAYNLDVKKAAFLAFLFLAGLAGRLYNASLGAPIMVLAVFLAMSDAYGSARGKGFFSGLGSGIKAFFKLFFGLLGLVLWTIAVVLLTDAATCWLSSGTPVALTVNLSGGVEAVSRDMSAAVLTAVVAGAALLLFFLHGFGRKLLWARGRQSFFGRVFCVLLLAAVVAGVLASVFEGETQKALSQTFFAFPVAFLQYLLALPATVGKAIGVAVPSFAPGFLDTAHNAAAAVGGAAAEAFSAHNRVFQYVLLGGLIGFLPFLFASVVRGAKQLPEYAEWSEMWRAAVAERTETLKAEWEAYRQNRAVLWERRRQLLEARHRTTMKRTRALKERLARIETIAEQLAEKAGVTLPPPLPKEDEEAEEGITSGEGRTAGETLPLSLAARARVAGETAWHWGRVKCWPALAKGGRQAAAVGAAFWAKVVERVKNLKKKKKEGDEDQEETAEVKDKKSKATKKSEGKSEEKKETVEKKVEPEKPEEAEPAEEVEEAEEPEEAEPAEEVEEAEEPEEAEPAEDVEEAEEPEEAEPAEEVEEAEEPEEAEPAEEVEEAEEPEEVEPAEEVEEAEELEEVEPVDEVGDAEKKRDEK